jgi:hypothetical protein
VTFAVPQTKSLDSMVASLLIKYNKTYCGANDVITGKPRPCLEGGRGDFDIRFIEYGNAIERALTMGAQFVQGMVYNEVNRLLILNDKKNFLYTTDDPGASNNIFVYDPAKVDNIEFPNDGLVVSESLWELEGARPSISAFVEVLPTTMQLLLLPSPLPSLPFCPFPSYHQPPPLPPLPPP